MPLKIEKETLRILTTETKFVNGGLDTEINGDCLQNNTDTNDRFNTRKANCVMVD